MVAHFGYSIYASEYVKVINNRDEVIGDKTISVGTYNLKSLAFKKEYLDNFSQDIEGLDLDVICLQEVDKKSLRSDNVDMVKELAQKNNYPYYHFYQTMWLGKGYYGLGIISKYPITQVAADLLPNPLLKEPRILTHTIICYNNENINIYNTHLSYERDQYRTSQLEFVKSHINTKETSILCGDFNTWDYNEVITVNEMNNINGDKQYLTFSNSYSVDDILYTNNLVKLESGMKISSFSDHNLLYSKFEIK